MAKQLRETTHHIYVALLPVSKDNNFHFAL
jgi:hypothetical protein